MLINSWKFDLNEEDLKVNEKEEVKNDSLNNGREELTLSKQNSKYDKIKSAFENDEC